MLYVCIFCCMVILPSLGLHIVYEKLEHLAGFDVFASTLRVRKYNRTTTVLNGTLTVKLPMNDTFLIYTDLFYSSLGNQQFNHYPMKLPVEGTCKFIQNLNENYPEHFKGFINFPKPGECPIKTRHIHLINQLFPSKAIPPTFPKGLWKVLMVARVGTVERMRFELTVKVYSDDFF